MKKVARRSNKNSNMSLGSRKRGQLMGEIALTILVIIESIVGFNNRILKVAVYGIVAVGACNAKKAQLLAQRDLAVWRTDTSSISLVKNTISSVETTPGNRKEE